MQIYHLALTGDWRLAAQTGRYETSTLGLTLQQVGFIHCSGGAEQYQRVAKKYYANVTEALTLLTISTALLDARGVRWLFEDSGAGEEYPHIYGPILTSDVVAHHACEIREGELVLI